MPWVPKKHSTKFTNLVLIFFLIYLFSIGVLIFILYPKFYSRLFLFILLSVWLTFNLILSQKSPSLVFWYDAKYLQNICYESFLLFPLFLKPVYLLWALKFKGWVLRSFFFFFCLWKKGDSARIIGSSCWIVWVLLYVLWFHWKFHTGIYSSKTRTIIQCYHWNLILIILHLDRVLELWLLIDM